MEEEQIAIISMPLKLATALTEFVKNNLSGQGAEGARAVLDIIQALESGVSEAGSDNQEE